MDACYTHYRVNYLIISLPTLDKTLNLDNSQKLPRTGSKTQKSEKDRTFLKIRPKLKKFAGIGINNST